MAIAKEMIGIAAIFAKCDYVKFQKRTNKALLSPEEYAAPHPNPAHSYGATYGEHREFLEFDIEQHAQLQRWCQEYHIGYSSSVWDLGAAKEIAGLDPAFIKIPSACNLDFPMLAYLAENYGGEIHISLGMTTPEEQQQIVAWMEHCKAAERVTLYACTSGYPVPFEQVCLLELEALREKYAARVQRLGFSGHHLGIAVDIGAITLGAEWVERHFTLDRTWKGTDHAASLEPDGLRKLVRDIRAVSQALSFKEAPILEIEVAMRKKLKRMQGVPGH